MLRPVMAERAWLIALLAFFGAGWGATQPLAKISVSEGYRHFGLTFWQLAISAVLLGMILALRGRPLPLSRPQVAMYAVIALIGSVLPSAASYQAAVHLPAGILSILLSLVPMFAFPIAMLMATDRFGWLRLIGLICGLAGVAVIVGPETSLPERAMAAFIPLALVAPISYAFEGNIVARFGTARLDPIQLLCGASIVGAAVSLPIALGTGHFINPLPPWGRPDYALIASSVIHTIVYCGYVWMVGRTGAVFAAQASYLVTGFGVIWAMLLLGERYSGWVWAAMALMFAGLFMVQPRRSLVLVSEGKAVQDADSKN